MQFEVVSPKNTPELLLLMEQNQKRDFRFGAGCTDLLVEFRKHAPEGLMVINLGALVDDNFTNMGPLENGFKIGALCKISELTESQWVMEQYPVLFEAALNLASPQIRALATVGGNLCTASPAGDVACALMAIEAKCEIMDTRQKIRTVALSEFFSGVRETVMKKTEVLRSILIPQNSHKKPYSGFVKIGTRCSMECAVISLGYHIQLQDATVVKAGIAIGSAAPTIRFTTRACEFLLGLRPAEFGSTKQQDFADMVCSYADPIDDVRASEWYRRTVLNNISKQLFSNYRA